MLSKIAIGSVQFGLNYGISNTAGQVTEDEIDQILEYAISRGINYIDTAQAYGNSEQVLGRFSKKYPLVFITKLKADFGSGDAIISSFKASLHKLNVDALHGLLYHDFQSFKDQPNSFEVLKDFKRNGQVKKIGFSLYHPEEVQYLVDRKLDFDIVQVPYNIFDRRFEPWFEVLNSLGVEIHVRSTFLQGIIFMDTNNLPSFFNGFSSKLALFNLTCERLGVSPGQLALQFVAANPYIAKIVLGVQSLEHLKVNIEWLEGGIDALDMSFTELQENNLDYIIPSNWKL
jgi:aryl-alcohol dehydrogenase-like predicted oxidoreductase